MLQYCDGNASWEKGGTRITKLFLARYKKICVTGTLYCTQCTDFFTQSRAEMNYHYRISKKHPKATARVVHECKICDRDFHGFYNLREHKRKDQGAQRGSAARNIDVTQLVENVDDISLKEDLETCKHFFVDSEIEKGRHRVYNFAMDTLEPKNPLEKLYVVFDSLKCASKLNVAFGFVLKDTEDGSCR